MTESAEFRWGNTTHCPACGSPDIVRQTADEGRPFSCDNCGLEFFSTTEVIAPAEIITDPDRAEMLGLTADARRMRAAEKPAETPRDRRVIQCNLTEGTNVFAEGARAYVVSLNPGGGHERIVILGRSRGGRWVEKWESIKRLDNFRIKTLPPEHPLYESERIWDAFPFDKEGLQAAVERMRRTAENPSDERDENKQ